MLIGLALLAEMSVRTFVPGEGYELKSLLVSVKDEFKLPAIAAAVVLDGKTFATEAVGVRKLGTDIPVKVTDKFSIGSCTKSMTATVAAMLVQEGKIRWDTKIGEIFPAIQVNSALRDVTLEQLMAHRAGIKENLNDADMDRYMHSSMKPEDQRNEVLAKLLTEPPASPPGSSFMYSNLGFTVAGAMLERVAGQPWESLVAERIFKPLGMSSAGFGAPATPGRLDEPWGHLETDSGLEAVPPGPDADNPPAIGPAGTVHCSVTDLAKYAMLYLQAAKGKSSLLAKSFLEKVESDPYHQEYELGWIVVDRTWALGRAIMHGGSNNMFYTSVWIAPNRNFAIVVATNAGGDRAKKAADKVVHETVVSLFSPKETAWP